jgi:hypothetical protein
MGMFSYLNVLSFFAGQKLEEVEVIEQFTVRAASDPVFVGDVIPKFYLSACLALW